MTEAWQYGLGVHLPIDVHTPSLKNVCRGSMAGAWQDFTIPSIDHTKDLKNSKTWLCARMGFGGVGWMSTQM